MYAFLPREAVTRFLMSCKDCQKRMHLQINTFQKNTASNGTPSKQPASLNNKLSKNNLKESIKNSRSPELNNSIKTNKRLDFNLPITNAYLEQINQLAKTSSMLNASDLNSLMCNNLSYLNETLNQTSLLNGNLDNLDSNLECKLENLASNDILLNDQESVSSLDEEVNHDKINNEDCNQNKRKLVDCSENGSKKFKIENLIDEDDLDEMKEDSKFLKD